MTVNIVSSVIANSLLQIDGRHVMRETHTDDQGNVYHVDYVAEVGTDLNAMLTQHAIAIGTQ